MASKIIKSNIIETYWSPVFRLFRAVSAKDLQSKRSKLPMVSLLRPWTASRLLLSKVGASLSNMWHLDSGHRKSCDIWIQVGQYNQYNIKWQELLEPASCFASRAALVVFFSCLLCRVLKRQEKQSPPAIVNARLRLTWQIWMVFDLFWLFMRLNTSRRGLAYQKNVLWILWTARQDVSSCW